MYKPTDESIDEAVRYLEDRLNHETSMSNNLDYYLRDAAKRMIDLCEQYNIPANKFSFEYNPELSLGINSILQSLLEEVENACFTLACDTDKGDESLLLPFVNREVDGLDFEERLETYIDTFASEVEDFITLKIAQENEQNAWDSSWRGYSHKGNSAFTSMDRLTRFAISSAFMFAYHEEMEQKGCIGFYSMRGSSYPCDMCEDMVGFHTLDDSYPPYHSNCKCLMIPIYK